MADAYTITPTDELTIIRFHRELSLDEMFTLLDDVASVDKSNRRLYDVRKGFNLDSDDIRRIAERGKRIWPGPARVALLADKDLSFGLLRVFEAFRDADGYQTRAFRDEDEALAWLRESGDN